MTEPLGDDAIRRYFEESRGRFVELASAFVDDADVVVKEAESRFGSMIPMMGYVENPTHPMAGSVFWCDAALALYLVLRERGVDVHDFGRALIERFARDMEQPAAADSEAEFTAEVFTAMVEAAAESQRNPQAGEFVYELVGPEDGADWGMNIKSCAICASYSKHDAMALVPYMCATDDVVSDAQGQGLRRTGTIALGAHQCDFRYKRGGEPLSVAEQYPVQIRVRG